VSGTRAKGYSSKFLPCCGEAGIGVGVGEAARQASPDPLFRPPPRQRRTRRMIRTICRRYGDPLASPDCICGCARPGHPRNVRHPLTPLPARPAWQAGGADHCQKVERGAVGPLDLERLSKELPLIMICESRVTGCAARSCQTRRCARPQPPAAPHRGAREPAAAA
jgi:hypothetical protein